MNVFIYFRDVISGRIKHLNKTLGVVTDELLSKAEDLESPNDSILENFIVSAGCVVESLIWPQEKSRETIDEIIDIDLKRISLSISPQQVRKLYDVLLGCFTFMLYSTFYGTNSPSKEKLKKVLFGLVKQPELAKEVLQSLDKIDKTNWFAVGSIVWAEAAEIVGSGSKKDPRLLVWFTTILQTAFYEALKAMPDEVLNAISAEVDF